MSFLGFGSRDMTTNPYVCKDHLIIRTNRLGQHRKVKKVAKNGASGCCTLVLIRIFFQKTLKTFSKMATKQCYAYNQRKPEGLNLYDGTFC